MTIEIGTKFIKQRGKHTNKERVETVTDILKTYNSAGEHIKTRYVAEHDCCGQTVKRRQIRREARREACITLAVEVFGWSVVILGAAVTAKVLYTALVYIMLF